jgi:protein gp37
MTNIEWVKNPDGSAGFTWNPITGCLNHVNGLCKGGGFPCYAYKLANTRLKQRYLANTNIAMRPMGQNGKLGYRCDQSDFKDPFYPRFWEEKVNEIWKLGRSRCTKAKGIFPCDMSDLFGIGVPEKWTRAILDAVSHAKPHRFYLLTKQPQNLIKWSPFPENCWVGVTATNTSMAWIASKQLSQIEAAIKFLSIEPLLSWKSTIPYTTENIVAGLDGSLDLIIIGACTGTVKEISRLFDKYPHLTPMPYGKIWTAQPRIEWLREIVAAADIAGVQVFLKDNLRPLLIPEDCSKPNYLTEDIFWASEKAQLRQEVP